MQTGTLPGFARVIVYFPDAVPHYSAHEFPAPVFATRNLTGDAFDVRLKGAYGLAIALLWADTAGRDGGSVGPAGDVVVDGRLWDTGDQIALMGLGLSRAAPFRASAFRDPARLVIDVATTPGTCATAETAGPTSDVDEPRPALEEARVRLLRSVAVRAPLTAAAAPGSPPGRGAGWSRRRRAAYRR